MNPLVQHIALPITSMKHLSNHQACCQSPACASADTPVCSATADITGVITPSIPAPTDTASSVSQPSLSDSDSEEERHNFALSKDGAKIIASNKEAKKASAILDTDSDTFMKNECKADKWLIVELSQVQHNRIPCHPSPLLETPTPAP